MKHLFKLFFIAYIIEGEIYPPAACLRIREGGGGGQQAGQGGGGEGVASGRGYLQGGRTRVDRLIWTVPP